MNQCYWTNEWLVGKGQGQNLLGNEEKYILGLGKNGHIINNSLCIYKRVNPVGQNWSMRTSICFSIDVIL